MAKLTTAKRKKIPKSQFGLPGKVKKGTASRGAYPMPDKLHARVAKAYASKEVKRGNLSKSQKAQIDAKANRVLGKGKKKVKRAKK